MKATEKIYYYFKNRVFYGWFKNMRLRKKLLLLIAIKLIIMFGVLKLFFFNETLNTKFQTDEEKSEFVIRNLIKE